MRRLRVDAAAPGLVDREPLRLGHLDTGLRQRRLDHAVPRLLPGILGVPHLADEELRLVTEQDVKLKCLRRPPGAVLPHALVDLVVLLARQRRRCVPDENGHDANLTPAAGPQVISRLRRKLLHAGPTRLVRLWRFSRHEYHGDLRAKDLARSYLSWAPRRRTTRHRSATQRRRMDRPALRGV